MTRVAELPLMVVLIGIAGLAMFVPSFHAFVIGHDAVGRAFLYSGVGFVFLASLLGIATSRYRPRNLVRDQLVTLVGAYLLLPFILAVPFVEAVRDTAFLNAWFEMVSSFTTTGATLYDAPGRLPPSVHLWRAVVGWLGGYFVLVSAAAVLAPMNLGGFEVLAPRTGPGVNRKAQTRESAGSGLGSDTDSDSGSGSGAPGLAAARRGRSEAGQKLRLHAIAILPVYAGLTLTLWVWLLIVGDPALVAASHAMSTLSTSAISPVQGLSGASSGIAGEVMIFLCLGLAVTRRGYPGAARIDRNLPFWRDPELRLAAIFVTLVPLALFLRHWIGAIESDQPDDLKAAAISLWGSVFTVLSFLTTTGFEASGWAEARIWSGLASPGLILLGLAIMGGGVATTAGGVRLLRVHALYGHGRREMQRLVHPHSVAGGGALAQWVQPRGAYMAFITFILFALSLGLTNLALALAGIGFERGLVLSVAALTTTGPLADAAVGVGQWFGAKGYAGLGDGAKIILALAMVLGRLETLALLVLLSPSAWRR